MTTTNPPTMGTPLKKLKDLPKSIITHMPFIMFRPMTVEKDGNEYAIMDFLYFYQDLTVTSLYHDGQYFDEMPTNNTLSFEAPEFDRKVGMMVIRNTYYFNVNLREHRLYFKMNASKKAIKKYNKVNPDNPIGNDGYIDPETKFPMFFTDECDIVIPPLPPT